MTPTYKHKACTRCLTQGYSNPTLFLRPPSQSSSHASSVHVSESETEHESGVCANSCRDCDLTTSTFNSDGGTGSVSVSVSGVCDICGHCGSAVNAVKGTGKGKKRPRLKVREGTGIIIDGERYMALQII